MWDGEIWGRQKLAPFPEYRSKSWCKPPDCGTRTSAGHEWGMLVPVGLWLAAAISWRPWRAQWKCARHQSSKRHPEQWLGTFKSRGTIRHTFVVPKFALPNFACS